MRISKIIPVFLLSCALVAPAAMADPGHGKAKGKYKVKDKDKHSQTDRGWDDDDDGGMRFQGMDRNRDGRISRAEWRGNDQSFANHDWNGDGILSGAEVLPGARGGDDRWNDDTDWNGRPGWENRFADLDRNDDGYLFRSEWPGADRTFSLLDLNRDGRVSFREVQEHYRQRR